MRDYPLERVRGLLRSLYDSPRDLDECEERLDLLDALGRLPPTDRRLLLWRAQGYTYREIAAMLGLKRSDSRVKQAERRLVAALSA